MREKDNFLCEIGENLSLVPWEYLLSVLRTETSQCRPPWQSICRFFPPLGNQLSQAILHQYHNPPNLKALFGVVKSPRLEEIFDKSKPRYFKRTSSAVWNSPPFPGAKSLSSAFKRCWCLFSLMCVWLGLSKEKMCCFLTEFCTLSSFININKYYPLIMTLLSLFTVPKWPARIGNNIIINLLLCMRAIGNLCAETGSWPW